MSENFLSSKKIVWKAMKKCTKDTMKAYEENKRITSPVFKVPIGGEITEWHLGLFPNGLNNPSHICLLLIPKIDLKLEYLLNFTFFINGKLGREAEYTFHYTSDELEGVLRGAKLMSHAKFAELFDDLVLDGNLMIGCEIEVSSPPDQTPVTKVSDDFQKMFEDETLADFELRCNDDVNLPCHKVILAARSTIFEAMLSNDMKEAKEGFAEVQEFDSTVVKEVLRFIYCGRAENLDNISYSLVFAADYYDLEILKQMCIQNIMQNLTKENVIEVLLITEKISDSEKLFKKCVMAVERHFIEISQSQDWESLSKGMLTKIMAEFIKPRNVEFIG